MAEKTTATEKTTAKTTTKKKKVGVVIGGNLNLREEPDLLADVVKVLPVGATITVLEDCGDWLRVDGGYVVSKWIQK